MSVVNVEPLFGNGCKLVSKEVRAFD